MLNSIGPKIEPCGTPDSISKKSLNIPFMFTACLLFFKYDRNELNVFLSNPYASSLAIKSSWGRQSHALLRSL